MYRLDKDGKKSPMPFLPDNFEDYFIILLPTISKRNNELTNQKCLHEHLRRTRCLSGKEQSNVLSLRCDSDVPEISLSSLPSLTTPRHASFPSLSAWPLKTKGVEKLLDSLAQEAAHTHGAGCDRSSGADRSVLENIEWNSRKLCGHEL